MMSTFGEAYRPKSPNPVSAPIKFVMTSNCWVVIQLAPRLAMDANPAYPNHLKGLAIITISSGISSGMEQISPMCLALVRHPRM